MGRRTKISGSRQRSWTASSDGRESLTRFSLWVDMAQCLTSQLLPHLISSSTSLHLRTRSFRVCHGPAALAYVKTSSGSYLLDGHAVTGFSTSEEDAVGLTSAMPFILEDQLNVASGGKFEKAGADWGEKVVVSGKIITGQNPASASGVGQAILKAIQKK